ncbi:hypothetical protein ACFSCW_07610 [Sphingomonas tabacisoli]|uniref:DUF4160 domain-containing protein n=1 Tax=Sphingomonas tabacisoli TaxID=2249466 RepID=A0ABW4I199_9SPHN
MFQYRLFCLDDQGKILHPHVFHAEGDDAALSLARDRQHRQHACELWRGTKLIASLPAQSDAAAQPIPPSSTQF